LSLIDVLDESISEKNPSVTVFSNRNVDDSSGSRNDNGHPVRSGGVSIRDSISVEDFTLSREEEYLAVFGAGNNSGHSGGRHGVPTITSEEVVNIVVGGVDEMLFSGVVDIIDDTVGAVSNVNGLARCILDASPIGSGLLDEVIRALDAFSEMKSTEVIDTIDESVSSNVKLDKINFITSRGWSWARKNVTPFILLFGGDHTSLSEPKVMSLIDAPDYRVLSDRDVSKGTRDLGPIFSGLLPNLMVEIDSDDLLGTSRDLDELLGQTSGSSLPSSSGSKGRGSFDSLVDFVVSTDSPDITISDITNGNIEHGLRTEVLPTITLWYLSGDTSSHGSNTIGSNDPEVSSETAVNS
jgi:hypothetical protein